MSTEAGRKTSDGELDRDRPRRRSATGTGLDRLKLERLLDVGRSLVIEHDPNAVLTSVLEAARELTGARFAALGVLDHDKRELERFLTAGIDSELRRRIGPLPRGKGILGELIRDPRPLRLRALGEHPLSSGLPRDHPPMQSFLGVPVLIRGEVYGNLYLAEKQEAEEFTEEDQRLLVVLSEWAAIAIDNARLHDQGRLRRDELERALRGMEVTVELDRELGGETKLDRVLELVARRGRALVEARSSVVLLIGTQPETLEVAEVAGQLDRALVGSDVWESDPRAVEALRVRRGRRYQGRQQSPPDFDSPYGKSVARLIVPLRSRGIDLGVLSVFGPGGGRPEFSDDDELALESFAVSAASAIAVAEGLEKERMRLSIASSERERAHWARELHDETLQELGALSVIGESALQSEDAGRMREALARSNAQVERIAAGLRGLITELRPAALDQLGVEAAIEALVERVRSRSGLAIELDIDLVDQPGGEPRRLSPALEATIYRTAQEALNNVVKHAAADNVRVLVEERDGWVRVLVEDDGVGIDPRAEHEGYGLQGMRERVAIAGGSVSLSPGTGGGTRLTVTLPADR